jgi:hypothetical protein
LIYSILFTTGVDAPGYNEEAAVGI